jgi:hypothetical protein
VPLSEVPIEKFPGLLISVDPGEVGASGAVDGRNFDLDQVGRVKSRQGYVKHTLSEGTNKYDSLHTYRRATNNDIVLAGAGLRLESIINGAVSQTTTANASPHYFTSYGTATESRVYIANGTDTVKYYTDDSFTTPSYTGTTPTGKFVATQQPDNRLVVARTASNRSRVLFSDPGDPHTFGADNYVDLSPGDGEEITALVTWREYVFAFKETKFYVFYGNDTDATGEPIFNVRGVYGAGVRIGRSAVAGKDGVYFLDRRGVFRSQGGEPQIVSSAVSPLFAPISDTSNDRIDGSSTATPSMFWHDDRVYLAYSTVGTANDRVLVYHCTDNWWASWDVPAAAFTVAQIDPDDPLQESLLFAYDSGLKHIGKFTNAITDDGTAMDSWYRTGYMDYGDSTRKCLLDVMVDGAGTLEVSVFPNFASSASVSEQVSLLSGTGRRKVRLGARGHNFGLKVASVNGSSWRVNRIVQGVRSKQPLGVE